MKNAAINILACLWLVLCGLIAWVTFRDVSRSSDWSVLHEENGYAFLAVLLAVATYTQTVAFRLRDRIALLKRCKKCEEEGLSGNCENCVVKQKRNSKKLGQITLQLSAIVWLDSLLVFIGLGTLWGVVLNGSTFCTLLTEISRDASTTSLQRIHAPVLRLIFGSSISMLVLMHAFSWYEQFKYFKRK